MDLCHSKYIPGPALDSTRRLKFIHIGAITAPYRGTFGHLCCTKVPPGMQTCECGASATLDHCNRRPMWTSGNRARPNPRLKTLRTPPTSHALTVLTESVNWLPEMADDGAWTTLVASAASRPVLLRSARDPAVSSCHTSPRQEETLRGPVSGSVTGPRGSPNGKPIAWQLPYSDTFRSHRCTSGLFPAAKLLIRGEVAGRSCGRPHRCSVGGGLFRAVTPDAGLH